MIALDVIFAILLILCAGAAGAWLGRSLFDVGSEFFKHERRPLDELRAEQHIEAPQDWNSEIPRRSA